MPKFPVLMAAGVLAAGVSALAVEVLAAAPSAGFAGAYEQQVELSNFDFSPKEIHLQAGHAYALILTNMASGGHNFSAREFFDAATIQPEDAALVADGKVEIPAMTTRTVHLVPAAGSYKLLCSHTGHAFLGMKGKIVVE